MKKLLLTAGGRAAALLLAPLFDALHNHDAYHPVALLVAPEGAEPLSRELAECFHLGESCRRVLLPQGTPVEQLAAAMTGLEKIFLAEKPDLVLVCGSDSVALATALTAAKLGLRVAAVDGGLRSYDRQDGEEVNRVVIDAMAEFHFVSEHSGEYNLINEGVADEQVFFSGNLSIDSLVALMEQANREPLAAMAGIAPKKYAMVLLNPAGSFSGREPLEMMLRVLGELALKTTVVMPLLPGLESLLREHSLESAFREIEGLKLIEAPSHTALLLMVRDSLLLLTDSEELQSEATVMNVPCLTMLESCHRPSTIEIGTNALVGLDEEEIMEHIRQILQPGAQKHLTSRSKIPEKWDGAAAGRIVAVLNRVLM